MKTVIALAACCPIVLGFVLQVVPTPVPDSFSDELARQGLELPDQLTPEETALGLEILMEALEPVVEPPPPEEFPLQVFEGKPARRLGTALFYAFTMPGEAPTSEPASWQGKVTELRGSWRPDTMEIQVSAMVEGKWVLDE